MPSVMILSDAVLLPLAIKMLTTAAIVIVAALAAERAGPQIGGLIASLPVSAGPAYVFLALKSDDAFIATSALSSLAANAATGMFLLFLALFAARLSALASFAGALGIWGAANVLIRFAPADATTMVVLNVVSYGGAILITRRMRFPVAGGRAAQGRFDLVLRALLVACLVGAVVTVSDLIGPSLTGVVALFPMTFTSVGLLIHTRLGGDANAAAMASALKAMLGFAAGLLTIHLAAIPLGRLAALVLALLVCVGWSGLLIARQRRAAKGAAV